MARQSRHAFTLVELLVVIAIIGILVGLLVPAVQMVRENARNVECLNNVRNLTMATTNYETSKQKYPGYLNYFGAFAGGADPLGGTDPAAHVKLGSWAVAILPQLDLQSAFDFWSMDRYPIIAGDVANQIPGDTYDKRKIGNHQIFICPSDVNNLNELHGPNSYVSNNGYFNSEGPTDGIFTLLTDPTDFPGAFAGANWAKAVGTPWENKAPRPIRSDSIRDSKSQTLLITENAQALPWYAISVDGAEVLKSPASDLDPTNAKYFTGTVFYPDASDPTVIINSGDLYSVTATIFTPPATVNSKLARPSSYHTGHVNCGFADGSTKSVNASIDYKVYQALLTPFGKKSSVPDKEFVITDGVL